MICFSHSLAVLSTGHLHLPRQDQSHFNSIYKPRIARTNITPCLFKGNSQVKIVLIITNMLLMAASQAPTTQQSRKHELNSYCPNVYTVLCPQSFTLFMALIPISKTAHKKFMKISTVNYCLLQLWKRQQRGKKGFSCKEF